MTPFKITFLVSGGFVPPPLPLHLDALLAYQRTQQHLPRLERTDGFSVEALRALGEKLPLEKFEQDGEWCWMASALIPSSSFELGSRFYTQRRDQEEYAQKVESGVVQQGRYVTGEAMKPYSMQIDTLRGVYRNLLGFYPLMNKRSADDDTSPFLALEAWGVGDIEAVRAQFESGLITHLGSRRRAGHGRIESISIEPDEQALDKWRLRIRPWKMEDSDEPIQAAWKAPYWAAENRVQAFCPMALI